MSQGTMNGSIQWTDDWNKITDRPLTIAEEQNLILIQLAKLGAKRN